MSATPPVTPQSVTPQSVTPLSAGLEFQIVHTVTAEMSPPHLSGVLATWRLLGLIEDACLDASTPHLETGRTTVGTQVTMSHVGTARLGEEVAIRVTLVKVTAGRLLTFEFEARTARELISSGTHQRLVIDKTRYDAE